jgi:signal transduction histidine kinase
MTVTSVPGPVGAQRAAADRYLAAMSDVPQVLDLVSRACRAPMALIVVAAVAEVIATHGIDNVAEIPATLWQHVMTSGRVTVIDDVTGVARVQFMAAVPLHHEGQVVGALCVFDDVPRRDGEAVGCLLGAIAHRVDEETLLRHRAAHQPFPAAAGHDDVVLAVSHEIRTPLANIVGSVEILTDMPRAIAPGFERRVDAIRRNTDRLCRTVENLLHAASLQQDKLAGERRVIDLSTVVSRAAATVEEPEGRMRVCVQGEPVPVRADARLVQIAVEHLLSNALRFSDGDQPVAVTVSAGPSPAVTVRDHGPGVDQDELAVLGTPFLRGAHARDSQIPGLGLGLSVSRGIAEAHGGALELASTPGDGFTARLTLPVCEDRVASPEGIR